MILLLLQRRQVRLSRLCVLHWRSSCTDSDKRTAMHFCDAAGRLPVCWQPVGGDCFKNIGELRARWWLIQKHWFLTKDNLFCRDSCLLEGFLVSAARSTKGVHHTILLNPFGNMAWCGHRFKLQEGLIIKPLSASIWAELCSALDTYSQLIALRMYSVKFLAAQTLSAMWASCLGANLHPQGNCAKKTTHGASHTDKTDFSALDVKKLFSVACFFPLVCWSANQWHCFLAACWAQCSRTGWGSCFWHERNHLYSRRSAKEHPSAICFMWMVSIFSKWWTAGIFPIKHEVNRFCCLLIWPK